jgi:hypothetical protein
MRHPGNDRWPAQSRNLIDRERLLFDAMKRAAR